jgi:flavin-dependent dehydrogenase
MHYEYDMPEDLVELHSFQGGYAGLSKIENGLVNCCYLATFDSFKPYKDIDKFNEQVLSQNKNLNHFFKTARPAWEKPISISQISFEEKRPVENDILMIGDTAGLIHPLCGNGQAMAIHSAALSAQHVDAFLSGSIDRDGMNAAYSTAWNKQFSQRMRYGRWLQRVLLNKNLTNLAYRSLAVVPAALPWIVRKTHGKPF